MSDAPQGPGWWQASDGKWYSPEQAPGYQPPTPTGPSPYAMPVGGGPMGPASAGDAFSYGWNKFTQNVGPLVIVAAIGLAAYLILTAIGYFGAFGGLVLAAGTDCTTNSRGVTTCDGSGVGFFAFLFGFSLFMLLVFLGTYLLQYLLVRAGLLAVDGRPMDTGSIISTERLGPYLVGSVLMSLLTAVGFLLCIIPGLVIAFLGWFFGYFILDRGMSPVEAIKASFTLVKDNVGQVLLLWLLTFVAYFLGQLACGVGILAAYPVVAIATAYMYRRLQGQPVAP